MEDHVFQKIQRQLFQLQINLKLNLSVVKSVIKSNKNRSKLLTKKSYKILNGKIKNKKICFLGVTFKANTDDMRDSSSLPMIPTFKKRC